MSSSLKPMLVGAALAAASVAGLAGVAGAAKPGGGDAPACSGGALMTLDVTASPTSLSGGNRVSITGAGRNCTSTSATVTVRKSATGPGGITSGCNLPAPSSESVTVAAGGTFTKTERYATSKDPACRGTYTATVQVYLGSSLLGSDSASFTVV
jgi:hypothetical protein